MARMIPPHLHPDCRSPGEKLLFGRFRDDPSTYGWVVLHSLEVAKHPVRTEGEIDFVVIVPNQGVLCIEVKAGNVVRDTGIWKYGTGPFTKVSSVGPFRQASEAMHAIRKHILQTDSTLSKILYFSGVFFTYVDFDEVSPEWHPWQYADRSMLCRNSISDICLHILRNAHEHFKNTPSARWYDSVQSCPTSEQVSRIVNLLRGDFEYFVSPRTSVEESEEAFCRFTEEQFSALDVLEENERIIYKGPAGTGKTFLAIETARRSLLEGRRTLLTCYNAMLGHWLTQQIHSISKIFPGSLTSCTFHRVLIQLSGLWPPAVPDSEFWAKKVPDTVMERVLIGIVKAPLWDTLIIDEAQDLITEEYLDVMDLLLEGGLAGGRWVLFGDFEHQAIYSRRQLDGGADVLSITRRRSPVYFSFPLRINCRNTVQIASGLELTCKLKPGYSRVLHHELGEDIDIDFYRTSDEQTALLRHYLKKLCETFVPSEIVVLSTKEDRSSCSGQLCQKDGVPYLTSLREDSGEKACAGFASIHAFKGMESPAVILTDIDRINGEKAEALLYVGMSRARMKLVILMHESCRDIYLKVLQHGLTSRGKKGMVDGKS